MAKDVKALAKLSSYKRFSLQEKNIENLAVSISSFLDSSSFQNLSHTKKRKYLLLAVALQTGLSSQELVDIRVSNIKRQQIVIPVEFDKYSKNKNRNKTKNKIKISTKTINKTSTKTKISKIKNKDFADFEFRTFELSLSLYHLLLEFCVENSLVGDSFIFGGKNNKQLSVKRVEQIVQEFGSENKFNESKVEKLLPKDIREYHILKSLQTLGVEKTNFLFNVSNIKEVKVRKEKNIRYEIDSISDNRIKFFSKLLYHTHFSAKQVLDLQWKDISIVEDVLKEKENLILESKGSVKQNFVQEQQSNLNNSRKNNVRHTIVSSKNSEYILLSEFRKLVLELQTLRQSIGETSNSASFIFASKSGKQLSQRRIEQILSETKFNLSTVSIRQSGFAETLATVFSSELKKDVDAKNSENENIEQMLVVRQDGFLEVYSWTN